METILAITFGFILLFSLSFVAQIVWSEITILFNKKRS